jgi:hypothetical protein
MVLGLVSTATQHNAQIIPHLDPNRRARTRAAHPCRRCIPDDESPRQERCPICPVDKAIAAATAHGLVWVPKNTKEHYKSGGLYGKGQGEFMPEAEAQKAGNHEKT